jgi:hypothetical protein
MPGPDGWNVQFTVRCEPMIKPIPADTSQVNEPA